MTLAKVYNPTPAELNRRNGIVELQEAIERLDGNLGENPFPLTHHFAPGIYAREILLPKDTLIIGKIHRHEHLVIFLYGDVTVESEKGQERINTPGVFLSPMGIKRAVYAHVDSVMITIHPTEETDLDKIETEVIAPSFADMLPPGGQ